MLDDNLYGDNNPMAIKFRVSCVEDDDAEDSTCPSCDRPVGDGDRFCSFCGLKLGAGTPGEFYSEPAPRKNALSDPRKEANAIARCYDNAARVLRSQGRPVRAARATQIANRIREGGPIPFVPNAIDDED